MADSRARVGEGKLVRGTLVCLYDDLDRERETERVFSIRSFCGGWDRRKERMKLCGGVSSVQEQTKGQQEKKKERSVRGIDKGSVAPAL